MEVESLCKKASKTFGLSDGKEKGKEAGIYEQITQTTGQVVLVLGPYADLIGQQIHID